MVLYASDRIVLLKEIGQVSDGGVLPMAVYDSNRDDFLMGIR